MWNLQCIRGLDIMREPIKERNAIIIMVWVIIAYWFQQGSHSGYYYTALNSIQKIGYVILFTLPNNLLILRGSAQKPFTFICSWFLLFFCIMQGLKLLPEQPRTAEIPGTHVVWLDVIFYTYFGLCSLLSIAMILYYNQFKRKT